MAVTNDRCSNKIWITGKKMKDYETQSLVTIIKFVLVFIKTKKKIKISDTGLHDIYKNIQK